MLLSVLVNYVLTSLLSISEIAYRIVTAPFSIVSMDFTYGDFIALKSKNPGQSRDFES